MTNPKYEYSNILSLFYYGVNWDYLSIGQQTIININWYEILEKEVMEQKPIDAGAFYLKYRLKMKLIPLVVV